MFRPVRIGNQSLFDATTILHIEVHAISISRKDENSSVLFQEEISFFCPFWHFCNKSATAKLEKVNERALRFVFNEKQTSYCELLNRIGLPSLENQRLAKIVSTAFNVISNEHAPKSIKDLIGLRNNKYNLRGSDILKLPKVSTTTYGLKSWRFMAPKLWNLLPDSSRINQTLKAFKNSIRTLDLSGLL